MKRPIIRTRERAVGGDVRESAEFYNAGQDLTYMAGYSDKRRRRDKAVRDGLEPEPLPFRLQFARNITPSGKPDGRKVSSWKAKGYRVVKHAELAGMGIEMPVGGEVNADGTIQVGDTVLMYADGPTARRNEENWRRATDEQMAHEHAPALEKAGREVGRPGEELTFAEGTRVTDDRMTPSE